jgi:hypothetical protein
MSREDWRFWVKFYKARGGSGPVVRAFSFGDGMGRSKSKPRVMACTYTFSSTLPRSSKTTKGLKPSDPMRPLLAKKIQGMMQKGYLEVGRVRTSLHYFAVAKGDSDIRVVYDGTSCGLNMALWSPNFFLPTAKSAGLLLSYDTWMADMDFGEFFHNFQMPERIRQHAGVNIKALSPFIVMDSKHKGTHLRWSRLFMGMKPSPYNSVRHYYWGRSLHEETLGIIKTHLAMTRSN